MELAGDNGVIAHFLQDCQARNLSWHSLRSYRSYLTLLATLLDELCHIKTLEEVKVVHLRQCVQHVLTTPSDTIRGVYRMNGAIRDVGTVRSYVRVWKVFFRWCYQEELIDTDPVARLKMPKPEKKVKPTFTDEQVEKMLACCDTSTNVGFRDYVIILLMLDTGIRLAEVASLRLVDIHADYIKVAGKGRKEREVGLHAETSKMLWKYIHKYRKPAIPDEQGVFLSCSDRSLGKPLRRDGITGILRRIKAETGLDASSGVRLSAHTFRHTFARSYMEQGGDFMKLSRELGHSEVQTTQIYLQDFESVQARKDHAEHSPISRLDLKKQKKRKRKEDTE